MFCAPGLIFGGTEGVTSRFNVLRPRTHFRLFRGRQVPFSCIALIGQVFSSTEGVGSRLHVLRSQTHFRRYRGRPLPLSCFAFSETLSTVWRASSPVFMFCDPEHIFGGSEGVGSSFHVFRFRTRFRRYRGRQVPFLCFALPDSFSAIPTASCPIFMFCAPGHVFSGTEGVGSRFHVLCSRTHFRRFRGHRVTFTYFVYPYSFSAVARASTLVLMFCVPGLVFGCTEGVGSRFHVLRS
jgi:hypothetical protein